MCAPCLLDERPVIKCLEKLNRRWLLHNVNLHPLGNTRAVHHHILYLLYGNRKYGSCICPVSAVSQLKPLI